MFIQTEAGSDENNLNFLPGRDVLGDGREVVFQDAEAARRSPLAVRLFQLEAVSAVTLGAESIVVTKTGDVDWQLIKPAVFGIIMEHFLAGKVTLNDAPLADSDGVVAEILELLEARVRPGLVEEGGDILFHGFEDGVARLELVDKGLALPAFSLQIRVENTLRYYIPAVTSVVFTRPAAPVAQIGKLDLDDPETAAVYNLLEESVNPAVAAHGGHISLIEVTDHIAFIRLEGGCQGCGMADVTLKQGVEVAILKEVPSITEVRDATDHEGGDNPFYEADKAGTSAFY